MIPRSSAVEKPPVFVVGPPRSGTTLLRLCLNRSDSLFILPETKFFPLVYGSRVLRRDLKDPRNVSHLLDLVFQQRYRISDYSSLKGEIQEQVILEAEGFADFLRILGSAIALHEGKERWGEKTPNHAHFLAEIFQLFPQALVVAIDRALLPTVASYLKRPDLPDNYLDVLVQYQKAISAFERYRDRIHRVSYEDFTRDPESILRGVCDFIGEPYQREMLDPGEYASSFDSRGGTTLTPDDGGIRPDKQDQWKRVISPQLADVLLGLSGQGAIRPAWKPRFRFLLRKANYSVRLSKRRAGLNGIIGSWAWRGSHGPKQ